jgi:hypothetical protein
MFSKPLQGFYHHIVKDTLVSGTLLIALLISLLRPLSPQLLSCCGAVNKDSANRLQ